MGRGRVPLGVWMVGVNGNGWGPIGCVDKVVKAKGWVTLGVWMAGGNGRDGVPVGVWTVQ